MEMAGKLLAGNDIIYGEDDTYREIREKIQPFLIPVMENLLKLDSRGKRVLDIGCGPCRPLVLSGYRMWSHNC